jgi:hypothetical protein
MKLAAYVPLLASEFPAAAFTTESLQHVARLCHRGFPTYPEIANHLSMWWRENRTLPRIAAPVLEERPPPTPEEIAYVRGRVDEIVRNLRAAELYRTSQIVDLPSAKFSPGPRYLTPEQLDIINPLPNGRKRVPQADRPAGSTDRPT